MGVLAAASVTAGDVALAIVNMLQVVLLAYLGVRTRSIHRNTNGHDDEPEAARH